MNELTTESIPDSSTLDTLEFELGSMLGERKAFGLIAGRCSAAHAECLKRLRDRKLYKSRCSTWEEFCPKYLRLSRGHANRIIRTLEKFGPEYFQLAELTRISPEEFRAIAPALKDKVLHVEGESIALLPENSDKLTAAIRKLRREDPVEIDRSELARNFLAFLERRCGQLIAEFDRLASTNPPVVDQSDLCCVLERTITGLDNVHLTIRV
jgi:hypothetical protein